MKQKILKGLKIVVIVLCVVIMAKCLFNSDATPACNRMIRFFYWNVFRKEIGEDRNFNLVLSVDDDVSELCVEYDEKKVDCRKMIYSNGEETYYTELFVNKDYFLDYDYLVYTYRWKDSEKSEYYDLELPDANKISVSSAGKIGVRLYVHNFFHSFSYTNLDVLLRCDVNHIEFEIDDEGVLITSESDLKNTYITLNMQDTQEYIDYEGVYEYSYWKYGSTNKTINAIYIKMISERECKVFLDLDSDGEFEYECVQEKR